MRFYNLKWLIEVVFLLATHSFSSHLFTLCFCVSFTFLTHLCSKWSCEENSRNRNDINILENNTVIIIMCTHIKREFRTNKMEARLFITMV